MVKSKTEDSLEYSLPVHENRIIGSIRSNFFGDNDNLFYTFYGLIKLREFFSPSVNKYKRLITYLLSLDSKQVKRIQNYKLMRILLHSYNNVPYYNSLFKKKNIRYINEFIS